MSIICTNVNRAQRFIRCIGLLTRVLRQIDGDRSSVCILPAGESGAVLGAGLLTTEFFTTPVGRADNVCRLRRTVPNGVDIKCKRPGIFSVTMAVLFRSLMYALSPS